MYSTYHSFHLWFCSSESDEGKLLEDINTAVQQLPQDVYVEDTLDEVIDSSFLLVFQTLHQQRLIVKYGNVVTCMDAIYRTNKYGFPCFFLVVKTSLGTGQVVGTIIPQYETTELIAEGLKILKSWNPDWIPKYFMTDKSAQELDAIKICHPQTVRYICDFHRAQAFERWVAKGSNGIQPERRRKVTADLKALAYSSNGEFTVISRNAYMHAESAAEPSKMYRGPKVLFVASAP